MAWSVQHGRADYCKIATGLYTGDGTISQSIRGIGFRPKVVLCYPHFEVETLNTTVEFWRSDQAFGDLSVSLSGRDTVSDALISLDDDGFTVDDGGANLDPNILNMVYEYVAWG